MNDEEALLFEIKPVAMFVDRGTVTVAGIYRVSPMAV